MSYLRQQTTVPWFGPGSLFEQLGSDYKDDRFGRRAFRTKVIERLLNILDPEIWPDCHVQPSKIGLVLRPSRTHVPKLQAKTKIPPQSERARDRTQKRCTLDVGT